MRFGLRKRLPYLKVVTNNTIDSNAVWMTLYIREDDEKGIFPPLSSEDDMVASKQIEFIHPAGVHQGRRVVVEAAWNVIYQQPVEPATRCCPVVRFV